LRVATFLRAQHAPIDFEYAHSGLTVNLHGEVMESEVSFQSKLAYTMAFAALHSHEDADFMKSMDRVNELHKNAFYSIPYYGKMFKPGTDGVTDDMKAMAERYKQVFKKTIGDKEKK